MVSVFGTSVSTSIVTGIFSLLNNYARKTTKKVCLFCLDSADVQPLGPLNQLIYTMAATHPTTFADITIGDNTCTEKYALVLDILCSLVVDAMIAMGFTVGLVGMLSQVPLFC
jgi:hypothetical protein